jgi:hypothetical protein
MDTSAKGHHPGQFFGAEFVEKFRIRGKVRFRRGGSGGCSDPVLPIFEFPRFALGFAALFAEFACGHIQHSARRSNSQTVRPAVSGWKKCGDFASDFCELRGLRTRFNAQSDV